MIQNHCSRCFRIGVHDHAEYAIIGIHLLEFREKTIQLERFLTGIFYLTLAKEIGKAASYTILLLHNINEDVTIREAILEYTLHRLSYFISIEPPENYIDYMVVSFMKIMMGYSYIFLNDFDSANNIFRKLNTDRVSKIYSDDKDIMDLKEMLILSICISKILTLRSSDDPSSTIDEYLDFVNNSPELVLHFNFHKDFHKFIIYNLKNDKLKLLNYYNLSKKLYPHHIEHIASIAISIGQALKNDLEFKNKIFSIEANDNIGFALFINIAHFSLCISEKKMLEAKEAILKIEKSISAGSLAIESLGSTYYQRYADMLYEDNLFSEAYIKYKESNDLDGDNDDFVIGWNNFKLGLLSKDDKECSEFLLNSYERFIRIKYLDSAARAIGALGTHHLLNKRYGDSIEIIIKLTDLYYENGFIEVGVALRLLVSHAISVFHNAAGISDTFVEIKFIPLDIKQYLIVSDSLILTGGAGSIFYVVSELAGATNLHEMEKKALKRGVYSAITCEIDKQTLSLIWRKLFMILNHKEIKADEICKLLQIQCRYQPVPYSTEENSYFQSIFEPFLKKAKSEPENWIPILIMVTTLARNIIEEIDSGFKERWNFFLDQVEQAM